jgi:hypothetical protein
VIGDLDRVLGDDRGHDGAVLLLLGAASRRGGRNLRTLDLQAERDPAASGDKPLNSAT